ncbi:MAG: hypothetical protein IJ624_05935 [Prevotella sp.]|nr:hypothetical protein [Prevotella sp.]
MLPEINTDILSISVVAVIELLFIETEVPTGILSFVVPEPVIATFLLSQTIRYCPSVTSSMEVTLTYLSSPHDRVAAMMNSSVNKNLSFFAIIVFYFLFLISYS